MKTPELESHFNKVAGLHAYNLAKNRLQHWCFPLNNAKFLRTSILKNICERLLLSMSGTLLICGALRDLVQFVQFKKREKHLWKSANFSKVAGQTYNFTKINTPPWVLFRFFKLYKWYQIIVQMVPNRAMHHII